MNATITIKFLSYWHISSGHSRGGEADAVMLKDTHGLPYVPGRTLKGLFREAVQMLEDFSEKEKGWAGITQELFGGSAEAGAGVGAKEGQLIFEDAGLPEEVHDWLAQEENKSKRLQLFDLFSQTALTDGQATDATLRMIEVCVPVELSAEVAFKTGLEQEQAFPDKVELIASMASKPEAKDWFAILECAAGLIRSLGAHRRRGLGRCKVTITTKKGDTR